MSKLNVWPLHHLVSLGKLKATGFKYYYKPDTDEIFSQEDIEDPNTLDTDVYGVSEQWLLIFPKRQSRSRPNSKITAFHTAVRTAIDEAMSGDSPVTLVVEPPQNLHDTLIAGFAQFDTQSGAFARLYQTTEENLNRLNTLAEGPAVDAIPASTSIAIDEDRVTELQDRIADQQDQIARLQSELSAMRSLQRSEIAVEDVDYELTNQQLIDAYENNIDKLVRATESLLSGPELATHCVNIITGNKVQRNDVSTSKNYTLLDVPNGLPLCIPNNSSAMRSTKDNPSHQRETDIQMALRKFQAAIARQLGRKLPSQGRTISNRNKREELAALRPLSAGRIRVADQPPGFGEVSRFSMAANITSTRPVNEDLAGFRVPVSSVRPPTAGAAMGAMRTGGAPRPGTTGEFGRNIIADIRAARGVTTADRPAQERLVRTRQTTVPPPTGARLITRNTPDDD